MERDAQECWKTLVECVILALVLGFLLGVVARGGEPKYKVAFIRGADHQGKVRLNPMTMPSFVVERLSGGHAPETGKVMLCEPFVRHVEVVRIKGNEKVAGLVHEACLNCGEHGIWAIKTTLFQRLP